MDRKNEIAGHHRKVEQTPKVETMGYQCLGFSDAVQVGILLSPPWARLVPFVIDVGPMIVRFCSKLSNDEGGNDKTTPPFEQKNPFAFVLACHVSYYTFSSSANVRTAPRLADINIQIIISISINKYKYIKYS